MNYTTDFCSLDVVMEQRLKTCLRSLLKVSCVLLIYQANTTSTVKN